MLNFNYCVVSKIRLPIFVVQIINIANFKNTEKWIFEERKINVDFSALFPGLFDSVIINIFQSIFFI